MVGILFIGLAACRHKYNPLKMQSTLPDNPSLDHLKKQAKQLRTAHRKGTQEAITRIRAQYPKLAKLNDEALLLARFSINDAQHVVAREYGYPSWAKLKEFVDKAQTWTVQDVREAFKEAVIRDQPEKVLKLGKQHSKWLAGIIDEVMFSYEAHALVYVTMSSKKKIQMLQALLDSGADINKISDRGYSALQLSFLCEDLLNNKDITHFLLEYEAHVDPWSATALGDIAKIQTYLSYDPTLITKKGPGGRTLLHFARTTESIDLLLEYGADIDAKCKYHYSTPTQYVIKRPKLCRHFINRGATPDIFIAIALDDVSLAKTLIEKDPSCLSPLRILEPTSKEIQRFGTFYIHSVDCSQDPLHLCHKLNAPNMAHFLKSQPSDTNLFFNACLNNDKAVLRALLKRNPTFMQDHERWIAAKLTEFISKGQKEALDVALEFGSSIHSRDLTTRQPIHIAAAQGNPTMAEQLLNLGASVVDTAVSSKNFILQKKNITALGMAVYSSKFYVHHEDSNYIETIRILLQAGSQVEDYMYEFADEPIAALLREYDTPKKHRLAPTS